MPEPDVETHQIIGKLAEEASELASICSRILIQGIDGTNPDSNMPNRQALINEISDVRAIMDLLHTRKNIHADEIRVIYKFRMKCNWLDNLSTMPP